MLVAEPNGASSFDVILMDLNMPRLSGMEAVQEMRRIFPQAFTEISRPGGANEEEVSSGQRRKTVREDVSVRV